MGQVKQYSREYKEEAIKLAEEEGCKNASEELGISYHTLYDWIKQARKGNLLSLPALLCAYWFLFPLLTDIEPVYPLTITIDIS